MWFWEWKEKFQHVYNDIFDWISLIVKKENYINNKKKKNVLLLINAFSHHF